MRKNSLSDKEWNKLVSNFLKEILTFHANNHGELVKLAKTVSKSKSTLTYMKKNGKGQIVTWVRILFYTIGINDLKAQKILESPKALFKGIKEPPVIDILVEKLKEIYDEKHLATLFRMMIKKGVVEEYHSLNKKKRKKGKNKKRNKLKA